LGQDYDWHFSKIRGTAVFVFPIFPLATDTPATMVRPPLPGRLTSNTTAVKRRLPTHPAILKNNKGSIKGLAEAEAFCYIFSWKDTDAFL
jgi:hypothetical protein